MLHTGLLLSGILLAQPVLLGGGLGDTGTSSLLGTCSHGLGEGGVGGGVKIISGDLVTIIFSRPDITVLNDSLASLGVGSIVTLSQIEDLGGAGVVLLLGFLVGASLALGTLVTGSQTLLLGSIGCLAQFGVDEWAVNLETTGFSKQPIRTRHLGHVTGYQPIRDQYSLISTL